MKNSRLVTTVAALLLSGLSCADALDKVTVKQIIVGPQAGDKPTNFSLNISIHNAGSDISDWKFGFYMPRNFRRTAKSNLNLSLRICEVASHNCSRLDYLHPPFRSNDLSSVFTTIVAPQNKFILRQGKNYLLSFSHSSSRGPQNYSSLPQNLFMVTPRTVLKLATSPATYQITDYDPRLNRQNIEQHLQQNWDNSTPSHALLPIIPAPSSAKLNPDSGSFALSSLSTIHDLTNGSSEQMELWQAALRDDLAIKVKLDQNAANDGILLKTATKSTSQNPEGYQIEINAKQITVRANNPAGFFYALQSLRQLWYQQQTLPALSIQDAPRFRYRGILLDVARHYFSPSELKNFIDQMAAVKLNTLHLHLSDDEAFRLNLADFPELSQIGAKRGLGLPIGPMAFPQKNLGKNQPSDKLPEASSAYGGSYSPSEIKQLISYANLRQITVIPEIDIPGHSRALMKALPEQFQEANDFSSYAGYGDDSLPVCAYGGSSKQDQQFSDSLIRILTQASQLFNQQTTLYANENEISIGGDEVFKGTWDDAPSCQLAPWNTLNSLQKEHYFFKLLSQDAKEHQLKFSGWHEFAVSQDGQVNQQQGIPASDVGHVWLWGKSSDSLPKAVALANADYPVVLDYSELLYFDMTYSPAVSEPGFYWASKFGDSNAALSAGLAASKTQQMTQKPQQILGIEGALWTDVIPSYAQLEYMAFPKIAGLAEAAWSDSAADGSSWRSLAERLGCGQSGFLAYLHDSFATVYRGYPNGIRLEAPQACKP